MYYVLHWLTKVLKFICLSIFTLRLLNNNSINVIPEQAFFYHRKIEILWVTTYIRCLFNFRLVIHVLGDILIMVVYLWLLRNCFHYGSFYFTTYESVRLKWKTSFLTTDKKQSLAKQKSMILYHDCFPWTTNDREQQEGLGGSCVAFFFS